MTRRAGCPCGQSDRDSGEFTIHRESWRDASGHTEEVGAGEQREEHKSNRNVADQAGEAGTLPLGLSRMRFRPEHLVAFIGRVRARLTETRNRAGWIVFLLVLVAGVFAVAFWNHGLDIAAMYLLRQAKSIAGRPAGLLIVAAIGAILIYLVLLFGVAFLLEVFATYWPKPVQATPPTSPPPNPLDIALLQSLGLAWKRHGRGAIRAIAARYANFLREIISQDDGKRVQTLYWALPLLQGGSSRLGQSMNEFDMDITNANVRRPATTLYAFNKMYREYRLALLWMVGITRHEKLDARALDTLISGTWREEHRKFHERLCELAAEPQHAEKFEIALDLSHDPEIAASVAVIYVHYDDLMRSVEH